MSTATHNKITIGQITIEPWEGHPGSFYISTGHGGMSIDEEKLEAYIIRGMSPTSRELLQLKEKAL